MKRKRGGRGLGTRLPSLRSENASDTLLRRQLTRNQVLPCQCVPLYPCPLQIEVDRFWILIQSYRACWIRLSGICCQRVCEFIEWLSSVCTNLDEARDASVPARLLSFLTTCSSRCRTGCQWSDRGKSPLYMLWSSLMELRLSMRMLSC